MVKRNEHHRPNFERTRIIAGAFIQVTALILLGAALWFDSVYDDTDFQQVELLLVGIVAAPAANELRKQVMKDKE